MRVGEFKPAENVGAEEALEARDIRIVEGGRMPLRS